MRKSRQQRPSTKKGLYWDTRKYEAEAAARIELFDSLGPQERELVNEYGFKLALPIIRQFYGRWAVAREHLEAARKALQVNRWENTT